MERWGWLRRETGEGAETRDGDEGGAEATHELANKSWCCV